MPVDIATAALGGFATVRFQVESDRQQTFALRQQWLVADRPIDKKTELSRSSGPAPGG
jgi:hypothetical protein